MPTRDPSWIVIKSCAIQQWRFRFYCLLMSVTRMMIPSLFHASPHFNVHNGILVSSFYLPLRYEVATSFILGFCSIASSSVASSLFLAFRAFSYPSRMAGLGLHTYPHIPLQHTELRDFVSVSIFDVLVFACIMTWKIFCDSTGMI